MSPALLLRLVRRQLRGAGGRVAVFVGCLAVGVAAVVAVSGLSSAIEGEISRRGGALLAADLVVEGHQPVPESVRSEVTNWPGATAIELRELVTMVRQPESGKSLLAELKAVEPGYPLRGELTLDPDLPLARLDRDQVAVDASLLERLGIGVGGELELGGALFRVAAVVVDEPDRVAGAFSLGPRIMLLRRGLSRTGLEGWGSRVEYRLLARLDDGAIGLEALKTRLTSILESEDLSSRWRVQTLRDGPSGLKRAVSRIDRFLGLVALISLIVGGVGVAETVRSWMRTRLDDIAVMRCLGFRPVDVALVGAMETLLLGVVGSVVGGAVGTAAVALLPRLAAASLPIDPDALKAFQPGALAQGMSIGVVVALAFGLPPLLAVWRIPPIRVLRRDVEPLPGRPVILVGAVLLVAGGVFGTAWAQAGSANLAAIFTLGVSVSALALWAAAHGIIALVARLPRTGLPLSLRHGLASLARPGAGTLASMVAIGIGVLVLVTMVLVEVHLAEELDGELPERAPTVFLLDVQPDQWPELSSRLQQHGGERVESVPVVMARFRAIDGRQVGELAEEAGRGEDGRQRWALTREQRLTWMEQLPADNVITDGALWSDPERAEVSLEEGFAEDLGVEVGSRLELDVLGLPVELLVTSLRRVEWRTFGINFFLVVEPGVLDDVPHRRLVALRVEPDREATLQDDLVARWPNVTVLVVRGILEKVSAVLGAFALAVRFLGGFTMIAGALILGGVVSAGAVQRGREVALLRALGFRRAGVIGLEFSEHFLVGSVASLVGTAAGALLARLIVRFGFEAPYRERPGLLLVAVVMGAALTTVTGLLASSRALRRRPIEALRQA